jgi:hypothetical protein
MTRPIRPAVLALLVAGAILMAMLLTGVLSGSGPASAGAAARRTHHGQNHTAHKAQRTQTADTDNVQSGDQSAPDNGGAESESAGENESAGEPAGEAGPGHEDPQGEQVDHRCPASCAPGEQP